MENSTPLHSSEFVRDLYSRMLLTRLVDECAGQLQRNHSTHLSCHGHEAAQVASALCIKVGTDFTLPYFRDLGVVLTIGMTPYEVLRTYVATQQQASAVGSTQTANENAIPLAATLPTAMHWGYAKHNTVTGTAPVATQVLHAAGIAFSCKLRHVAAVTVAYCGDGATAEPDFQEGLLFAAQHQLPVVIICEQDAAAYPLEELELPSALKYISIDGLDAIAVYSTVLVAMEHARAGNGPVLVEMKLGHVTIPGQELEAWQDEPLQRCQRYLEEQGMWDEHWASQLRRHLTNEVEQARQDATNM